MNTQETELAPFRECADRRMTNGRAWPCLHAGEVHIWKAFLDGSTYERDRTLLSDKEADRAARYRFAQGRMRFVAGRALLRTILGGYLDRPPAELAFSHGPHGKPWLVQDEQEEQLHFNVSHAGPVALFAITKEGELGIDIERIREIHDWAAIANGCFSPRERAHLRRLPDSRRRPAFFQAWTRREALLKASGDGLTGESAGWPHAPDSGYSVQSLMPVPGYLATLACAFPAPRTVFLTWLGAPASTASATVELPNMLS